MHYHKTPPQVVRIIKKHVPSSAQRILEPAVGEGALLEALRDVHFKKEITLVDIDPRRLESINAIHPKLSLVNSDFIAWSKTQNSKSYDLIITNPPFSARSENWVAYENIRLPIEMAFFRACLNLLQDNGTLIAIVPDTLINSARFKLEREWYFTQGSFTHVYQLPERSFENIEASFYLLVFKRRTRQAKTKLINVAKNTTLALPHHKIVHNDHRLDFSFYQGAEHLISITPDQSICLSEFCKIHRGPIRDNYKTGMPHHSTSFKNWKWQCFIPNADLKDLCIAVKRVSRNAHLSFGLFPVAEIPKSTDCIVFITPPQDMIFQVLFFLRCILSNEYGGAFLLKGSGAKFIQIQTLQRLPFFDLSERHPELFLEYVESYNSFEVDKLLSIERQIYSKIKWGGKVSLLDTHSKKEKPLTISRAAQTAIRFLAK